MKKLSKIFFAVGIILISISVIFSRKSLKKELLQKETEIQQEKLMNETLKAELELMQAVEDEDSTVSLNETPISDDEKEEISATDKNTNNDDFYDVEKKEDKKEIGSESNEKKSELNKVDSNKSDNKKPKADALPDKKEKIDDSKKQEGKFVFENRQEKTENKEDAKDYSEEKKDRNIDIEDKSDGTNFDSDKITFTINYGLNTTQIAKLLAEKGLVDEQEFLDTVNKEKVSTRLIYGTYTVDKDISAEEMVKILTNRRK